MNIFVIGDFSAASIEAATDFVRKGGKYVQLSADAPKGKLPFDLPEDVLVMDLRYGGTTFIRGHHPRIEGLWTQYSHLETGLARNITFSQTITDKTPIENWQSAPHAMQEAPVGAMASEEYRHAHNHFQLLHSEVYNFSRDLNGVAIWGDSAALAPGAKSWGAFFSARSWPVKWSGYTPENCFDYDEKKDFDAALVGVEIDVLNAGRDWYSSTDPSHTALAKVGLQLVGFGSKNTAAIEVRTEDSDTPDIAPAKRRGAWHWGIIMRNALDDESTVLMSENGAVRRGIDFDKTTFREGALRIAGAGAKSGIVFDDCQSGEIYADPDDGVMNLRIGKGGLRILDSTGRRVLLEIGDDGILKSGNVNQRGFWHKVRAFLGKA